MGQFKIVSICLALAAFGMMNVNVVKASTEYNRYLAHIFHKYGTGGTMSFEVSLTRIYNENTL